MADVNEAVEFLREANDAESENRQLALTDLKFRFGQQWPQYAIASRGLDRPQLTINEIDSYIRQCTNQQRQQRPRIKVQPVDDYADVKVAKVITGLTRHIEVNSDADNAYDTAFDFAATMGWGYWRLRTDFIAENSFNQDIFIDVVHNPFSVYFDPNSKLPDGSDAEKALITDMMKKSVFEKEYPGAQTSGFEDRGTGDSDPEWSTKTDIRVAEYFCVDRKRQKLLALSDGNTLWEDTYERHRALLLANDIKVVGDRESFRKTVTWRKQTSFEILEQKDIPGRWIPVIPCYWTKTWVDTQWLIQGLVRPAMDPQRMVNFWQTSITESIALAPKAKWLIAEGQDEGHEKEFARANNSADPVLRYKPTDVEGKPAPAPQRIAPEPPPSGAIEASFLASQNLQRVMGMFDPAVRSEEPKSGRAILAERNQAENSNYHGYDNLTRSIKHTGRIILSWIPVTYDTKRIQRIIGEDGRDEMVTLNDGDDAIGKVMNDVRVGTYDVVMETGPGYDTKRQEGVATMLQLLGTPIGEEIAKVGSDILVRQMDAPGMDVLADRLAAANPLSQIDEKSEVPPQAQLVIKTLQAKLEQAMQALQQAGIEIKFGLEKEKIKQDGATKRELMKNTAYAHDIDTKATTFQHDVETRALTAQNVAEIQGMVQLMLKHVDTRQLQMEIEARNAEQERKASEVTPADASMMQ